MVNGHNLTNLNSLFPIEKVSVGNATYGPLNVLSYGNPDERLSIGHYCSIAENVVFILSGGHNYKRVSSYPFPKIPYDICCDSSTKGPIKICDDVWLGYGVTILSGVTIGQGAVVAAGSVVAKDIPPYAIFAGGRIVKYRFPEEWITKLLKIDFGKLSNEAITQYRRYCKDELDLQNFDIIVNIMKNNRTD